ncbi:MAG: HAD family hydrolase [Clostridia bacterium]|nr:HAD family hydrolase [Clostridia bacterium]
MINHIDFSNYKYILFDLDATLLPFDQKEMSRVFFQSAHDYEADNDIKGFADAFSYAFAEMKLNNGSCLNKAVFDKCFREKLDHPDIDTLMDDFYTTSFTVTRSVVRYRGTEKAMIHRLRNTGRKVICATNPVFPMSATVTRMAWSDLSPEDFDFVTLHTDSTFCKPKAEYFLEILARYEAAPEETIMIGNDTLDDLGAVSAGIRTVLIDDYLINRGDIDLNSTERISYADFLKSVNSL